MTLSLKSADASFRAEDVKDESLKLIKNHCQKSYECTHEYQKKKIYKKSAEKPAGCNLLL